MEQLFNIDLKNTFIDEKEAAGEKKILNCF